MQGTSTLIEQVKENLKQKVIDCMNTNNDNLTAESIVEVFDTFEDPFSNLGTTYLQSSFVHNNMNFLKPIQYVLGQKIGFKNQGAKRQICGKDDTMMYIPILESIEQLLSNPRVFDLITSQPKECKDGLLYDICDGECLKNNPIFQLHKDALQIILYHDEVEVCNPLGSHTGKHKIDLYYYTLGNISPKFRSKLCAIRLLAIVKAGHVSKYGQNKVLTPIINDLHELSKGHTFNIQGRPTKLFGAVVSCLGDTEGQHQWGGFKVKVGWAHQKCRNCLCSYFNMQQKFRDSLFTARTLQQYHQQCSDIITAPTKEARQNLETTYGIVERVY